VTSTLSTQTRLRTRCPWLLQPPGVTPVFNFALARVHMNSETIASNVRVFFRSCRAPVTSATYDAQGPTNGPSYVPAFYRSSPATGPGTGSNDVKIPLLGVNWVTPPNGGAATLEYTAIPFFATGRVNLDPTQSMLGQQDTPNVHDIPAASATGPAVRYYGCWLDINQDTSLIPVTVPTAVPPNTPKWDGPFQNPSTIQQAFMNDLHQCLIAEISFDEIVIPQGDVPGTSAWLAQRNLGLVTS